MMNRFFFSAALTLSVLFLTTGCLKTRSEVGGAQQSQVYGKKQAENQKAKAAEEAKAEAAVDDRDELIRALNGRVETLENQISQMKAKEEAAAQSGSGDAQKMAALQEALLKMEAQIAKLEAESHVKSSDATAKENIKHKPGSSDANAVKPSASVKSAPQAHTAGDKKPTTAYETAEELFANKEWKKAILSYQKYVEDFPRGKSVPDSKYKIGVCFQELGLKDEAMAFYEEVIAQYGKTESGKKAKIRLSKLKK